LKGVIVVTKNTEIETAIIDRAALMKIKNDLRFIELISAYAKQADLRVIISGGYATDGNLGEVTRPHEDIDVQIYGNGDRAKSTVEDLVEKIAGEDESFSGLRIDDKGRQEYYHWIFTEKKGFGADIYYIQVADDPFADKKRVVRKDGTLTEAHEFDTGFVELEGVSYEAEKPEAILTDMLYKREVRGDELKEKHEQDITNLKRISDMDEVGRRLEKYSR